MYWDRRTPNVIHYRSFFIAILGSLALKIEYNTIYVFRIYRIRDYTIGYKNQGYTTIIVKG